MEIRTTSGNGQNPESKSSKTEEFMEKLKIWNEILGVVLLFVGWIMGQVGFEKATHRLRGLCLYALDTSTRREVPGRWFFGDKADGSLMKPYVGFLGNYRMQNAGNGGKYLYGHNCDMVWRLIWPTSVDSCTRLRIR